MPTQGARMGVCARLRYSLRRLQLRCRPDPRKKPGRTGRRPGRFVFKCASLFVMAAALSLALYGVVLSRRQDRDTEEFITSFQNMYDQGEDGSGSDGAKGAEKTRRYDPKSRPFVDPKMWRGWGAEADKGRQKRRLFMDVHKISKDKGRPLLTLNELMARPSGFDPSRGVSDTTIILNHWKRTTLAEQLDAILKLSVRPAGGVWVCLFDSPREKEYREVVVNYSDKFDNLGGLFFISSSFNFKYYGRFQMALQARTRYVWIIDDDVMPGSKFLQQLNHIAEIPEAEGADGTIGPMALGSVGWIMPGAKANGDFYSYRYQTDKGGLFLPDKRYGIPVPHLQEVDLLCSHWFIETDWVRLLFREQWETADTGEDYMLAYSLRKYAGVRSYVVPMDLTNSETWGNTDVEWNMQNQGAGATTLRSTVPMRDRLWHRLLKRGGEYFLSGRYAERPRPILFVADGSVDAEALRPLFQVLEASFPSSGVVAASAAAAPEKSDAKALPAPARPPRLVLTGRAGNSLTCSKAAVALGVADAGKGRGSTLCMHDSFASAWNLMAGRHFPREGTGRAGGNGGRDHALMTDLAAGLAGTVETVRPLAIVSVAGSGPSAGPGGGGAGGAALDEALALVAEHKGVPLIRLPRREDSSAAALWLSRLTPRAFGAWHAVRVDVLVVYDTAVGHTEAQLRALLDSLSAATYLGDTVDLTIAIGSGSGSAPDSVVDAFAWPRGRKVVRASIQPPPAAPVIELGSGDGGRGGSSAGGGIAGAALGTLALRSWTPRDDDTFVLVLEADRVVSEFFYSWLKAAVLQMAYGSRNRTVMQAEKGVCVPGAGGGGAAASRAWLFSPAHWRAGQVLCLGGGGARDVDTPGVCSAQGYLKPPERALCPLLKSASEALVARTGDDGAVIGGADAIMGDGAALAALVTRVFFSQA